MANEATKVEGPYETHDMTISGVTAIPMGTVMVLSDPRTGVASSTTKQKFAGITDVEKKAGDNATEIGCITKGTMLMTASGAAAIVAGDLVVTSGANVVETSITADDWLSGCIIGKALEDIAGGTTGEVKVGDII